MPVHSALLHVNIWYRDPDNSMQFNRQFGLLYCSVDSGIHTPQYYRKRGSASYIVREVHSVRQREIQRERERERKTEVTSPLSR